MPLRLPRSLRSLGLPASSVQGKPLHSVCRVMRNGCAIVYPPPWALNSLRCPSPSLATLARTAPGRFHYSRPWALRATRAMILGPHSVSAAFRSNRLPAAYRPQAHYLSATALLDAFDDGLRAPSRSRFARFVGALRSRSV